MYHILCPAPIGNLLLTGNDHSLTGIEIARQAVSDDPCDLLLCAQRELQEYFAGTRRNFSVPVFLRGTSFQQAVWQALQAIPYGETRSYCDIAALLGNPKASRAVGAACHANPLLIVVPCHRVVGVGGSLTGFAAGLDAKAFLLTFEKEVSSRSPVSVSDA